MFWMVTFTGCLPAMLPSKGLSMLAKATELESKLAPPPIPRRIRGTMVEEVQLPL